MDRRELAKRLVERKWQRVGATVKVQVEGRSMGSTLPTGSFVEVHFSERPPMRKGDIIYFRRGKMRVSHRLLAKLCFLCIEKGDASRRPGLCLYSDVLGIVYPVQKQT